MSKPFSRFIAFLLVATLLTDPLSSMGLARSSSQMMTPVAVPAFGLQALVGQDIVAQFPRSLLKPWLHLQQLHQFTQAWRRIYSHAKEILINAKEETSLDRSFEGGFILKGDQARAELLKVISGQSPNQPAPREDILTGHLPDITELQTRVTRVLEARKTLPPDIREKILLTVASLTTKRKVGFQSIVLGSKNLPGQTDQFALGYCLPEDTSTLGYAADLLTYLRFNDSQLKTTHLLEEYVLHEALEAYFDHETSRRLQRILFPENYRSKNDEGLLRESLRSFVELRTRQEPVPTLPYNQSRGIGLDLINERFQAFWKGSASEEDLIGMHFDTVLLSKGRAFLKHIEAGPTPNWYVGEKYEDARVRVFVRTDPYRPGRSKWMTYRLAADGETLLDLLATHQIDRGLVSCFSTYRDLQEEQADQIKAELMAVLENEQPLHAISGKEFYDTPRATGRIALGYFKNQPIFIRLGRDYLDRKVRVRITEEPEGIALLEVRSVDSPLSGEPLRFQIDKTQTVSRRESGPTVLRETSPERIVEPRELAEEKKQAQLVKRRMLAMARGEFDEQNLIGSFFVDTVNRAGNILIGHAADPEEATRFNRIQLSVGVAYAGRRVQVDIRRSAGSDQILYIPSLLNELNEKLPIEVPVSIYDPTASQLFGQVRGARRRRVRLSGSSRGVLKASAGQLAAERPVTFEDEIARLRRAGNVSRKLFNSISKATRIRLIQRAADAVGIPVPHLAGRYLQEASLDSLPGKTLSSFLHQYRRVAQEQKWEGDIMDFIRKDLGLDRPATVQEDLLLINKFPDKTPWSKIGDDTHRFLVERLLYKARKLPGQLYESDFVQFGLEALEGRPLGDSYGQFWTSRKPANYIGTTVESMIDQLNPSASLPPEEEIARLKDTVNLPWRHTSLAAQARLVEILSKQTGLHPQQLGQPEYSTVPIPELGGRTLSAYYAYCASLQESDDPRTITQFISDRLGLTRVLSIEEELESLRSMKPIFWQRVSPRFRRYLIHKVAEQTGKSPWQLNHSDFEIPLPELAAKDGTERSLVGLWQMYHRQRIEPSPNQTLELILADLGLLGPQQYEQDTPQAPTRWQRLEYLTDILGTRRLYVDLDETLFWPDGWIGSEDWRTVRGETRSLHMELEDHERRMVHAGALVATDPEAVAVIKRLQAKGVEVIGLTARGRREEGVVNAVLRSLDVHFPVTYVNSRASDAKAKRLAKMQEERGAVPTLVVDNDTASQETIEAARLPDVKVAFYEANRPARWKDPHGYLARTRSRIANGQGALAQEDLLNALELFDGQEGSEEERLHFLNEIGVLIDALRSTDIDVSPVLQSFLRHGARVLFLRNGNDTGIFSESLQIFLPRFFGYYFPHNGEHMARYYREGLIHVRRRQARTGDKYYFTLDETNMFPFMEPLLRYILHAKPEKVLVMDSGARPFYWALQAFVQAMGLETSVELFPLSLKTKGDTLKSTQHWLDLGKQVAAGTLALESVEEGAREAVATFAALFPLEGSRVLLVDDNMVSGDTLHTARRALGEHGVLEITGAVTWALRDGKVRQSELLQAYTPPGQFSWYRRFASVLVHSIWEDSLTLRGIKQRDKFNGNPIPAALTPEDAGFTDHKDFRESLVRRFLDHLSQYRDHLGLPLATSPPSLLTESHVSGTSQLDRRLAIYEKHPPRGPPLPGFSIQIDGRTFSCKPVTSVAELKAYITRRDARTHDTYADHLLYPDLTLYAIYDEHSHRVGIMEAVLAFPKRSGVKEKALVIDTLDLDYGNGIDPRAFVLAMNDQLAHLAESVGADWVLMPRLDWMVSGRPEVTRVISQDPHFRYAPAINEQFYPLESETPSETLDEKLAPILETRRLSSYAVELYQRHRDAVQRGEPADPAVAKLLRFRFPSLSRTYFRVLWRRIPENQKAALAPYRERLESIRPYLVDQHEQDIIRFMGSYLDMGIAPRPWQIQVLERLEARKAFAEQADHELQPWQNRFASQRHSFAEWPREEKLAYQALELYVLKTNPTAGQQAPNYPRNFFDGADGLIRAIALVRYVIFDERRMFDLRELKPKLFYDAELGLPWERAFNRDLLRVAEALYPGQYEQTVSKTLTPKPLTTQEILRWRTSDTQELAPGRSMQRPYFTHKQNHNVTSEIRTRHESWFVSVEWEQRDRLSDQLNKRLTIATVQFPILGSALCLFKTDEYARYEAGKYSGIIPLAVYLRSTTTGVPVRNDVFVRYLGLYREGRPISLPPMGGRFKKSTLNAYSSTTETSFGVVNLSFIPGGVSPFSLSVSPEVVSEQGIQDRETVVTSFIEDPNHGLVVQIFREADFNSEAPEKSLNPLCTYKFMDGGWKKVDLAVLDILAANAGRKDLKPLGRMKYLKPVSAINMHGNRYWTLHVTHQTRGSSLERAQFQITDEEYQRWGLQDTLVGLEVKWDNDYGPYIEFSMTKNGIRTFIGTRYWRTHGTRVDLGRFALNDYARGEKNLRGEPIEPRIYEYSSPLQPNGELLLGIGSRWVLYFSTVNHAALFGKRPIFVPERNLQYGWLIKVHDAEAYKADPLRSPDAIFVRDAQRKTLVPLEEFQTRTVTSEERLRFQGIAAAVHLNHLLGSGAALGPRLYQYLRLKFPEFSLGKLPYLVQDWLSRTPVSVTGQGGSPPNGRPPLATAQPGGDVIEPPVEPARTTPSSHEAIKALAAIRYPIFYRQMLQNQEATLRELKAIIQDTSDPEWKAAHQLLFDHFTAAPNLNLPGITPEGRQLMKLYQLEGTQFLIEHDQAALWDDPGLGKTLQSIAAAIHMPRRDPARPNLALAVVPASGIKVWRDEIMKWTRFDHEIFVVGTGGKGRLYHSQSDTTGVSMSLETYRERYKTSPPSQVPFLIISYGMQRRLHTTYPAAHQILKSLAPDVIILDEAHKLRNEESLQSQALMSLTAPHKIIISGRPLLARNRVKLWPLLNWLSPERFPSLDRFLTQYPDTLDGRMNLWIDLQDLSLRRRKRDVLLPGELPPMNVEEIRIPLRPEDEPTYRQMESESRSWLNTEIDHTGHLPGMEHIFSRLLRLAQFTSGLRFREGRWTLDSENPKVKVLTKIIEEKVSKGEKVTIFTRFVPVASALRDLYAPYKPAYVVGGVSGTKRDAEVARLQKDPDTKIWISTYGSGAETITLTAANNAVLYDLEYDIPEQPRGRIERLGQTRKMNLYILALEDTLDTDILELHAAKQEVFDQVIEGFFPEETLSGDMANLLAGRMGEVTEAVAAPLREMLEAFITQPEKLLRTEPHETSGPSVLSSLNRVKAVDFIAVAAAVEMLVVVTLKHPWIAATTILMLPLLYLFRHPWRSRPAGIPRWTNSVLKAA